MGGFDADGDGHEDVALFEDWQTAAVYHGPFEGIVPTLEAGDAFPSQVTVFGSGTGGRGSERARRYEDHLGPGQDVIGVGEAVSGTSVDTWFYPLHPPRGTWLGFEHAIAAHGERVVVKGALRGLITAYSPDWPVAVEVTSGWVLGPMGDLNGDGLGDLLARYEPDADGEDPWIVVALSPHAPVVDLSGALPLLPAADYPNEPPDDAFVDLDGDGARDLLLNIVNGDGEGRRDPDRVRRGSPRRLGGGPAPVIPTRARRTRRSTARQPR